MRKEIIFLLFIYSIVLSGSLYCSEIADMRFTNCSSYQSNMTGFSCYLQKIDNEYVEAEEAQSCGDFPDDPNVQKQFVKLSRGFQLEMSSHFFQNEQYYESEDRDFYTNTIMTYDKETYNKGETITLKKYELTESDKKVNQNKNNCLYHFYGKLED